MAAFCNFGATLEDTLHDQIVWGIKNDSMQQRLLQELKLTYKKTLKLAQGLETVAQNVHTLKNPKQEVEPPTPSSQSQDVHKINPTGKAVISVEKLGILHKSVASRIRFAISVVRRGM